MDDISFDDEPLQIQNKAAPEPEAARGAVAGQPATTAPAAPAEAPGVPDPLAPSSATSAGIAYITVADASGRVLFRRPATAEEVEEALRSSDEAEREGQAAMDRIASERFYNEALENKPK